MPPTGAWPLINPLTSSCVLHRNSLSLKVQIINKQLRIYVISRFFGPLPPGIARRRSLLQNPEKAFRNYFYETCSREAKLTALYWGVPVKWRGTFAVPPFHLILISNSIFHARSIREKVQQFLVLILSLFIFRFSQQTSLTTIFSSMLITVTVTMT